MALTFSSLLHKSFLYRSLYAHIAATSAVSVYSGTRPTAAAVAASWTTYNSTNNANFISHYVGATFAFPSPWDTFVMSVPPPSIAAIRSGSPTWGILWGTNVTAVAVGGASLPNSTFAILDVSAFGGTGVITFDTLAHVAGVSNTIATINIKANFVG